MLIYIEGDMRVKGDLLSDILALAFAMAVKYGKLTYLIILG